VCRLDWASVLSPERTSPASSDPVLSRRTQIACSDIGAIIFPMRKRAREEARAQLVLRIDPELHEAVRRRSFEESTAMGEFTPMNTVLTRAILHYLESVSPEDAAVYEKNYTVARATQSGHEKVTGPTPEKRKKK
jgi:hypothetical protein